jgi:O-succinylbenzoic acid--CoA ligase
MQIGSVECSLDIIYNNKRYSWNELKSRLDIISRQLACLSSEENHADSDNRSLAIISQDRFSIVVFLLHSFFNKRCYYPVSPLQPANYLSRLLVQSKVELVIADNNLEIPVKPLLLDNFPVNDIPSNCLNIHAEYTLNANELTSNTDSALLITTSGSLTAAKIVKLSFRNIVHHVHSFIQMIPITSQSLWLNCLPLEHIAGAIILYRCLLTNAAMLLDNHFDEKQVWQDINEYPVSHISLVPLMLKRILDHAGLASPPASLQYVLVGGDRISPALLKRAKQSGWPVYLSYGMTEACSTIALGKTPDKYQLLSGINKQFNSKGELLIKGPMVTSGYLVADSDNTITLKDHWLNTHDLVSCKGNFIQFSGRADSRIISGGETIDPQLVEELLSEFPGVSDVAVGKINHAEWGNSIVVIVQGNAEQLKSWAVGHLQKKYRPRFYIETDVIPRNPLGKINRLEVQRIIKQILS